MSVLHAALSNKERQRRFRERGQRAVAFMNTVGDAVPEGIALALRGIELAEARGDEELATLHRKTLEALRRVEKALKV